VTKPLSINWQRVVLNLRSAGLPCAAQARRLGHKDKGARVQRIARGQLTRIWFDEGMALLDLHEALCPEQHRLEELRA
jgi:hypothetical protein